MHVCSITCRAGAEVLKKLFLVVCGVGCYPGLCPISACVDVQAKGQEVLTVLSLFGRGNPSMGGDVWMLGVISLMRSLLDGVRSSCALSQLGGLCPQMSCTAPSYCTGESKSASVFTTEYPYSNSV